MATFNVFVEGPIDDSPTALAELAEAMSKRYGLPTSELVARLKRGRFRVKSNVDAANAERYRNDLETIGARVLVEDSLLSPTATPVAGTPVIRATPPTGLAAAGGPQHPRPTTPPITLGAAGPQHARAATPSPTSSPSNRPSTPPSALAGYARPSTPPPVGGPAHQRPSTPIPGDIVSGLSAAYSETPAQSDLGALSDESALSLASLDGEEAPAASNQFDAPPADLPPEPKAVITINAKPKTAKADGARATPAKAMDLFAPPDAGDQDLAVDLATEEVDERAKKKATAPPASAAASSSSSLPSMRRTPQAMASVDAPVYGTTMPNREVSRGQFLAGVVLALVIGFVPAHFVANMREKSAFAAIDQRVTEIYAAADSYETYAALDGARAKLLDEKQSKRTMIALTSMLLWAVVSAGVAFAFFRFAPKPKS
jgi:hypothetical protein